MKERVTAILDFPRPTDKPALQLFLGMLNYYNCFMPKVASTLIPLHRWFSSFSWSCSRHSGGLCTCWSERRIPRYSSTCKQNREIHARSGCRCNPPPYEKSAQNRVNGDDKQTKVVHFGVYRVPLSAKLMNCKTKTQAKLTQPGRIQLTQLSAPYSTYCVPLWR